jgi:fibronectin-binding autotransporter adhesin
VITPAQNGYEVLLTFATPIAAADIFNAVTLTTTATLRDNAAGPNSLISNTHAVSDIGLGLTAGDLLQRPVYAQTLVGGTQTITVFDGSTALRVQDITLMATLLGPVPVNGATVSTTLFWDTNVPSADKFGSVWLPVNINGLVPHIHAGSGTSPGVPDINPQNHLYTISATDPRIVEGATLQFFLGVGASPLICADISNPNASNWYRLLRPWSFQIRNIKPQKGNVDILSNVIDPTKAETTTLRYTLTQSGSVTVYVFDLKGDIVNILQHGTQAAGSYTVTWDGKNRGGRIVARGVYFIKIVAPSIEEIRKVLVVK